jgi:putative FmdB family regulatory protein
MPIYEFRCEDCEQEFEMLVFGSNDAITCPKCSGANLARLMSAFGFKSEGNFTPSSGSSGCTSCSGGNCSSCH